MNEDLYQKKGIIISRLAMELLNKQVHDRIMPISYYQEQYGTARGTVQNAFAFLKNCGAIELRNRGHLGTYIEHIDYLLLRQYSMKEHVMGVMPLPYSKLYEGMATGLYMSLKKSGINFNMAYVRGAEDRVKLVLSHTYDFAVCSRHAAKKAIEDGYKLKIAIDFGEGSFLSKHVLVLKNSKMNSIQDGMRIGIDTSSFDQRDLTYQIVGDKKISYVNTYSFQIISAILSDKIDAGIWNYDEIKEKGYTDIHYVDINELNIADYSSAVIVVAEDYSNDRLFEEYVEVDLIQKIQCEVQSGELVPSY